MEAERQSDCLFSPDHEHISKRIKTRYHDNDGSINSSPPEIPAVNSMDILATAASLLSHVSGPTRSHSKTRTFSTLFSPTTNSDNSHFSREHISSSLASEEPFFSNNSNTHPKHSNHATSENLGKREARSGESTPSRFSNCS